MLEKGCREGVSVVSNVSPVAVPKPQPAPDTLGENTVRSPLVGIFYLTPAPGAEPFVSTGQYVKKGETVCILEAMKILNEIKAPVSGIVKQVFVKNGDLVEFDQAIMEIGDGDV